MSLKFLFNKEISSSNLQPNSQEKHIMCHTFNGNNWDRVATSTDVAEIVQRYSGTLPDGLVAKIFQAMTSCGFIKPIALAFVCELVAGKINNLGVKNFGFFIPFSGMSLDGGLIRYQTPVIVECHNAWASFSMGQRSKEALVDLLRDCNVELMELHDCGCISTDPMLSQTRIFGETYRSVNFFRSFAESVGYPVITVDSFDELQTDMSLDALEAYSRIEQLMQTLSDKPNFQIPASVFEAQEVVRGLFSVTTLV